MKPIPVRSPTWGHRAACTYVCAFNIKDDGKGGPELAFDERNSGVHQISIIDRFAKKVRNGDFPKRIDDLDIDKTLPHAFTIEQSSYILVYLSDDNTYFDVSNRLIEMKDPADRYGNLFFLSQDDDSNPVSNNVPRNCRIAYFSAVVHQGEYHGMDSFEFDVSSPGRFVRFPVDPDIHNDGGHGFWGLPPTVMSWISRLGRLFRRT